MVCFEKYIVVTGLFLLRFAFVSSNSPKLLVTNDGPSVLDAPITFSVQFIGHMDTTENSNATLIYFWHDNATLFPEIRQEQANPILSKIYWSVFSTAGFYEMKVSVYKKEDDIMMKSPLVHGLTFFSLSDTLVGSLSTEQRLPVNHSATLVSTGVPLLLRTDLHDPGHILRSAEVTYSWYDGPALLGVTQHPRLSLLLAPDTSPTSRQLSVEIAAMVNQLNAFGLNTTYKKYARFTTTVELADSVRDVILAINTKPEVNKPVIATLTWKASPQVRVCWSLSDTETCLWSAATTVRLMLSANEPGSRTLLVRLTNSVSLYNVTAKLQFWRKPQGTSHMEAMAAGVGVCALLIALVFLLVWRRSVNNSKPRVETANFDFSPLLHEDRDSWHTRLSRSLSEPSRLGRVLRFLMPRSLATNKNRLRSVNAYGSHDNL